MKRKKKLTPSINETIIKKFYGKGIEVNKNTFTAKKILEESFGNLQKGLEAIEKLKFEDATSKALQKIRQEQQSLQRELEKSINRSAVTNPLTGAVRKQRFKSPEITNKLADVITGKIPGIKKEKKIQTLADGRKRTHILYKQSKATPYMVMDFMWENDIHDIFGLVKFYKNNKKRYTPHDMDEAASILRSLNFTPNEVLEYCINSIQTKTRFLKHRLIRTIEKTEKHALTTFITIYRKHLKSKLPLKSFFWSDDLKKWCADEDIFFKSEENLRQTKDTLVKIWNKQNPDDLVLDKKKFKKR
jgi:hypothetical protein